MQSRVSLQSTERGLKPYLIQPLGRLRASACMAIASHRAHWNRLLWHCGAFVPYEDITRV